MSSTENVQVNEPIANDLSPLVDLSAQNNELVERQYYALLRALRQLRIMRNINQAEMAIALNRSQSNISKYESGNTRLTIDDLLRILLICDTSPAVFFAAYEEAVSFHKDQTGFAFRFLAQRFRQRINQGIRPNPSPSSPNVVMPPPRSSSALIRALSEEPRPSIHPLPAALEALSVVVSLYQGRIIPLQAAVDLINRYRIGVISRDQAILEATEYARVSQPTIRGTTF